MNKAKFWLVQIALIAIVSLALGPTAIAAPKSKPVKSVTADITGEFYTHGEGMRLDNANLEEGNADWKTGDTNPVPACTIDNLSECTIENCGDVEDAEWSGTPEDGSCDLV